MLGAGGRAPWGSTSSSVQSHARLFDSNSLCTHDFLLQPPVQSQGSGRLEFGRWTVVDHYGWGKEHWSHWGCVVYGSLALGRGGAPICSGSTFFLTSSCQHPEHIALLSSAPDRLSTCPSPLEFPAPTQRQLFPHSQPATRCTLSSTPSVP